MKKNYQEKIYKTFELLKNANKILVGGGAGLSTAAGLEYKGRRFSRNFADFIEEYGLTNMYEAGFYPFLTQEEKWAYWSKHIKLNRYDELKNNVYPILLELIKDKEYFVITTNADGLFERNGFSKEKLFVVQGDYGKFQCASSCHNTLYDNQKQINDMVSHQKAFRIPSNLIPSCPLCKGKMEVNVRKDASFVEDKTWHDSYEKYKEFVSSFKDENIALLELGVGYNTPSIIKYPFEHITSKHSNVSLIRMNKEANEISFINKHKTLAFGESISNVFYDLNVYM